MATDEDASRAGLERAEVGDCDISGLTPSDPQVYTKPQMRDRIKAEIYCSDKGGDPGEWSARKAQLTVQRYEAEGGGYKNEGEFERSQEDLMIWTEQEWQTEDGTPSLPEGDRYLPRDFWDTLSEEEKRKVNETKEEGTEEGKQFVSLPEEISEKFAEWREENREKYLEEARENPNPKRERRQREMAREAHNILLGYVQGWSPVREPEKMQQTTYYSGRGEWHNVLYADADLVGFDEEVRPLHFGFHGTRRIAEHAIYKGDAGALRVAEPGEPGIFIRITGSFDYPDSLKKVEPEALTDSDFLFEHGASDLRDGRGPPVLEASFATVQAGVEEITTPRPMYVQESDIPLLGLGDDDTFGPDPSEVTDEDVRDALLQVARLMATNTRKLQTDDPDRAERAMREAVSNLRSAKEQVIYVLGQEKSTFIHEFQHHLDVLRSEGPVRGSASLMEHGIPTDEYFNVAPEVNARYQEGLADFEETILSNESDLRRRMEGGFSARDLFRVLERFTPQFEKLSEENQRRLYKRWFRYWKEIVEPRLEEIREQAGEEAAGSGLPEDLKTLLQAAETLADAQQTLEDEIEEAPGPLGRSMETDRKLSALEEKISEGLETLREKADARGYDFDTIVERTALSVPRENPPDPGGKRHLERDGEILDPDLYVTGFPGEPENTMTEEGIEGAKFKLWFGDWESPDADHSVVTGEEGRPLPVYHGTQNGGFNRFMVGEELRDDGSPGVFFTDSRRHAESYSGSNEDIGPSVIGPAELTDPEFGFEVEVQRIEKRAYDVIDEDGETVATVLEDSPRFPDTLAQYEEEGYDTEETLVDRYNVTHRGVWVLSNGTEKEKIVALEKIADEANDRAEIPPRQDKGILTAYLNVRDPLVLDFKGQPWEDPPEHIDFFSIDEASRFAKNAGYDALVAKNIHDPGGETRYAGTATEYIVFNGDQVAVKGFRGGQIAIPRSQTDVRLNPAMLAKRTRVNPPSEATVDVPGGPTYTVEPDDIILREGVSHEELSREKVAAPPVEARELAQKARKWKEKGAPGMHETGLRRMLQIGAGYQLSPAEMEVVKNWFARKKSEKEKGYHKMEAWSGHDEERPSESLLSWWGWGGEPMMEWVEKKLAEMPDRVRLTDEALADRENPLVEPQVETGEDPPIVVDSYFVDLTTEVVYPSPGTDYGFRLETGTLGETYAYGFSRRGDFGGEDYEGLAELSWIQVDEAYRGQGVGLRLLGDVLRFLSATGASHVAVRALSDEAHGLNERAEDLGLWHRTMESEEGMEMYAIDVGAKSRLGVPVTGSSFEFDADRDDVEDAIRFLYDPSDVVWRAAAQPTDARPYTYAQPLRPASSSGDLEGEYNRDVEIYETFDDAPDVQQTNGFFFRTDAPITVRDLTRTSAEPLGIDTRTWTLVNAVNSYQDTPGLPEFAIINRDKRWVMEIEQGEGEADGKTLVTFSRVGSRNIETHEHPSIYDALEETLRFRDRGDRVEYLPLEFVDTALDQWEEDERENPAEGLTREGVAQATRMLAYELRRHLWERGRLTFNDNEATEDLLQVAEGIEEGGVEVDPLSFQPIPVEEIPKGIKRDVQSALEAVGDLRTLEEFAEEEVMPFVEEGMEVETFDPYGETDDPVELLKRQLPVASSWQQTGYLTPDGTPLSLGGSGAARFKDHRDPHVPDRLIPDWLNPEKNFASMVALMEAGVIRVLDPGGGLGMDMNREPTPAQKQWIREAILSTRAPSEVIVDVKKPGEEADESDSAVLEPLPRKVIRFIEDFYSEGGGSKVARFRRRNPEDTISEAMARRYPTWKLRGSRDRIPAMNVKWIMPGGQAIGAEDEGTRDTHHNHFELPQEFETDKMPRRELVDRHALRVWVTSLSSIDHKTINLESHFPPTTAQEEALRDLAAATGADKIVGDLADHRGDTNGGVPTRRVNADSAERFIEQAQSFYGGEGGFSSKLQRFRGGRANPSGEASYVLAVGDAEDANLQNFKPESQRLVVMSPSKYLKHARKHFEDVPGGTYEDARLSVSRDSVHISGERIEELKERMVEGKPIDALWFDVRLDQQGTDSPIIGQEGRHRALAAKELGLRHVPVILFAHRQKKGSGMFGGVSNVKVPADGETFPERIMAGATEVQWPSSPTPVKTLWREARFGREFA